MLKITSNKKISQTHWMDEIRDIDWGDDDIDLGREHSSEGVVDEDNLDQFLVDDIEEPNPNKRKQPKTEVADETFLDELPLGNENLGIPPNTKEITYKNSKNLVYDGIDSKEVISFEYTNRHGMYVGLRTVEPHYAFIGQTTGNEVVVTFDRDISDIRAFIIGNIHPNGVRYKDIKFSPKSEIMRGVY